MCPPYHGCFDENKEEVGGGVVCILLALSPPAGFLVRPRDFAWLLLLLAEAQDGHQFSTEFTNILLCTAANGSEATRVDDVDDGNASVLFFSIFCSKQKNVSLTLFN